MLIFEKIDEMYFKVTVDKPANEDELQELWMAFTFDHPEKEFIRAYKIGKWDGKIRLIKYIDKYKTIAIAPIGLFNKIYKYMKIYNIDFKVVNDDFGIVDVDLSNFDKYFMSIKPDFIEYREYQKEAVKNALLLNRCVIESPTGSGKSLIIYAYIKWILDFDLRPDEKILMVVPTTDLVVQMQEELISYGFNRNDITTIFYGKEKIFNTKLIISTWQSIYKYENEFFEQFSGIIVDEAHKAKANEILGVVSNCINARWRLGTTGTLSNKKEFKYMVLSLFGPVFKTSTTAGLIKQSYLTDFHITNILLNWKHENKKKFDITDFEEEYNAILNNEERLNFISEFVFKMWENREYEGASLLILGKRIEYIEKLFSMLYTKLGGKNIHLFHGQIPTKYRKKILDRIKENGGIVVANISVMGTGINIPNISDIVFVNPIKSDILLLQSIGRSIRLFEGKSFARIYDIVDVIPVKNKKENNIKLWLDDKIKIYDKQQFKYNIVEFDLKLGAKEEKNNSRIEI